MEMMKTNVMTEAKKKMADCHPKRQHYAHGMCRQCYRAPRFSTDYAKQQFGEKLDEYRERYEKTAKGKNRAKRYQKVRSAISKVLGVDNALLSKVFKDEDAIAKLKNALDSGNVHLIEAWSDLTKAQKKIIYGKGEE